MKIKIKEKVKVKVSKGKCKGKCKSKCKGTLSKAKSTLWKKSAFTILHTTDDIIHCFDK